MGKLELHNRTDYLKLAAVGVLLGGIAIAGVPLARKAYRFFMAEDNHTDKSLKPLEQPPFKTQWNRFNAVYADESLITAVRVVEQPITARTFIGKGFKEDEQHPDLKGLALAKVPLKFAAIERASLGTTEYFGVLMTLMDGRILNQALLSNATSKGLGLDSGDIYNDWGAIDRDSPEMKARKARHESMGLPWFAFDRDRLLFRFIIGRDQMPQLRLQRQEPRPMILAVMRWVSGPEGRSFLYDLPEGKVYADLLAHFLKGNQKFLPHLPNPQCYNPTVGIWAIGHFSADVRANWRQNFGYKPEDTVRSVGSTQAAVQVLRFDDANWHRKEDALLRGQFVTQAEAFVRTHAKEFSLL